MKDLIKFYTAAKLAELQVIQGKLAACGIETVITENTFQGPGKLHELWGSPADKTRAMAIIDQTSPDE